MEVLYYFLRMSAVPLVVGGWKLEGKLTQVRNIAAAHRHTGTKTLHDVHVGWLEIYLAEPHWIAHTQQMPSRDGRKETCRKQAAGKEI